MDMPVQGWRVYCADGSTYTSGVHDPATIPATVQCVVFFHEHPYRTLDSSVDEYIVDGVTLYGSLMDESAFEAIRAVAFEDMAWPTNTP